MICTERSSSTIEKRTLEPCGPRYSAWFASINQMIDNPSKSDMTASTNTRVDSQNHSHWPFGWAAHIPAYERHSHMRLRFKLTADPPWLLYVCGCIAATPLAAAASVVADGVPCRRKCPLFASNA